MLDLTAVHRPSSPAEAVRLLTGTEGRGLYVAGGTILVVAGSSHLDFLVDLTSAGLGGIRVEPTAGASGTLVIGATTTVAELLHSPDAGQPAVGLLHEAAAHLANHTVRNLATVGGNLFAWHFPTDLPPALLVLDASITVAGRSGERAVPLEDLYARRGEVFAVGDLIVDIRVPAETPGLRGAFGKHGRKRLDVALVNCAAAVRIEGGRIAEARLALNGVGGAPVRRRDVEAFLAGKAAAAATFEEAGRMVSASVTPKTDHRASSEYRKRISGVAAKRALMRAAGVGSEPMTVRFVVNGKPIAVSVEPGDVLLDTLRANGFTGVKAGCRSGNCGVCTVLLDGRPVPSCSVLTVRVEGRSVTTIEGVGDAASPHPLQTEFFARSAAQCAYCMQGMIVSSKALLDEIPHPSDDEIREHLTGNLCRCTGYVLRRPRREVGGLAVRGVERLVRRVRRLRRSGSGRPAAAAGGEVSPDRPSGPRPPFRGRPLPDVDAHATLGATIEARLETSDGRLSASAVVPARGGFQAEATLVRFDLSPFAAALPPHLADFDGELSGRFETSQARSGPLVSAASVESGFVAAAGVRLSTSGARAIVRDGTIDVEGLEVRGSDGSFLSLSGRGASDGSAIEGRARLEVPDLSAFLPLFPPRRTAKPGTLSRDRSRATCGFPGPSNGRA